MRHEGSYEKRLSLVQTVELAFGAAPTSALIRARDLRLWEKLIPKSDAALRHAIWAPRQLK